jgi:succinate dehydrogenase / fumarate reductase cytochrome b subunit
MAETTVRPRPVAPRPLSPHLSIFRPLITMVMSIANRITGAAVYFGMLLLAWWLMAAAIGPGAYDTANAVFGSWIGLLILFGFTLAYMMHLLGGVRHLIWDTGAGHGYRARNGLSWATLIGSVVLTILLWIAILVAR